MEVLDTRWQGQVLRVRTAVTRIKVLLKFLKFKNKKVGMEEHLRASTIMTITITEASLATMFSLLMFARYTGEALEHI